MICGLMVTGCESLRKKNLAHPACLSGRLHVPRSMQRALEKTQFAGTVMLRHPRF
jgi:hypothetical protein